MRLFPLGHFVPFQPTMPVPLPAMEKPALKPAFQPVVSSPDLSPTFAVLWQLQHAQLLRQLHLLALQQLQPHSLFNLNSFVLIII